MSELEKCMASNTFNCIDKEITDMINKSRILTRKYNSSSSTKEKESILSELLGKIGTNVWIGGGVIILPGVTIGKNSVIGAGSVVIEDIPSDCVAVGNPCRVVKHINQKQNK